MYYIRHYGISPYNEALRETLENQYGIDVEVLIGFETGAPKFFVFDVSDLHPEIDQLNQILPEETTEDLTAAYIAESQGSAPVQFVTVIYMPQYTQDELRNAQWLDVRNTSEKVDPVNIGTVDTYQCFIKMSSYGRPLGYHKVQAEPYVLRKPLKWGRASFVSATYHQERLFCNESTLRLLEQNGFVGIRTMPVLRKSTGQPVEDIVQIDIPHVIPDDAVVPVCGMTEFVCEKCGMHMLRWGDGRSHFGLRKGVLDESVDLWKTKPMFFGRGDVAPHSAQEQVIVSQRLYRFLVDHKLDRGFVFTPLEMIDP